MDKPLQKKCSSGAKQTIHKVSAASIVKNCHSRTSLKFLFCEFYERSKPLPPETCNHNFLSAAYCSVHTTEKGYQLFLLQE